MAQHTTEQIFATTIETIDSAINRILMTYGTTTEIGSIQRAILAVTELQATRQALKQHLIDKFNIDYDSETAATQIIKRGSKVRVLVDHMPGMKGTEALVLSYSAPALMANVSMPMPPDTMPTDTSTPSDTTGGMEGMSLSMRPSTKDAGREHKWLTDDEVELM